MIRKRRTFTTEFKHEVARLVLDNGYTMPEANRVLDVDETVLRHWVQQLDEKQGSTTPTFKALTLESNAFRNL